MAAFNAVTDPRNSAISHRRPGAAERGEPKRSAHERAHAACPTVVLGGTGYVAGELLRLIAGHPRFELRPSCRTASRGSRSARRSLTSKAPIPREVPGVGGDRDAAPRDAGERALFGGAPRRRRRAHRPADRGRGGRRTPHCVDISADFRYPSARAYEAVYKHPHGAPARIPEFTCAVPEQLKRHRPRTWPIRGALRRPRSSPACRCSPPDWPSRACSSPASPAARARAASRSRARTIRCGTETSTATARSPTGMRLKSPPARSGHRVWQPRSISCLTRARSRAASTSPCRRR